MNDTAIIIIIVLIVLLIIAAIIIGMRRRNTSRLKSRFGSEYDRTLEAAGGRGKAETDLLEREKRVKTFDLTPLTPEARREFAERWRVIQGRFVDNPGQAVAEADALTLDVMTARGYPMSEFDQRADDISVDHPGVVQNYRAARGIAVRNASGQASTEDLRQATVSYRDLFEELVGDGETPTDAPHTA